MEERLNRVTRSDVRGFLEWVNNTAAEDNTGTAAGIIEAVRERIREVYNLADADLYR